MNRERINEILEVLSSNKLRTLLTAFGVFWGIFIFIFLLALTSGLKNGVSLSFEGMAANSMFIWGQRTTMPYKGNPKGKPISFKLDDVEAIKKEFKELKYVSPRNRLGGYAGANNVTRDNKTGAFQVNADFPEYINQEPLEILRGRYINYGDINEKRKVCVIGKDVVKSLFDKNEDPIGGLLKVNGVTFMVVGTFSQLSGNGDEEEAVNTIIIPYTSFSQAFNTGDKVRWMAITAKDHISITNLKEEILSFIKRRQFVNPKDNRAIGNRDIAIKFQKRNGLFSILSFIGYFVGALILMSGVIGVSNIMLIVVKERTKEIGVRRALGATPRDVKMQLLQETLTLTLISGMAGIAFAAFSIASVNYILEKTGGVKNFVNPSVSMNVIIVALSILVVSGLIAGLIPANAATKMKPVDALRTE